MGIFKTALFGKIAIGVGAFVVSLGSSYFIIPKKTVTIDPASSNSEKVEDSQKDTVYFDKFVAKLTNIVSGTSDETISGIVLDLDNITINLPSKSSFKNEIVVDGALNFKMQNLNDIDFSLDANVTYNSKQIDLGIAYTDETFYLATKDLRVKSSQVSTEALKDKIFNLFFNTENEEGLAMEMNLDDILDSLIAGLDLNSLMSGTGDLTISEKELSESVEEISLAMHKDEIVVDEFNNETHDIMDFDIKIGLYKEDVTLAYVDLGTITIGDVAISGEINCDNVPNLKVLGLDDPDYPIQRGEFIEVVNHIGFIDRIFNLLNTRKTGLELTLDLALENDVGTFERLTKVNAAIDFDFSNLFNLKNLVIDSSLLNTDENANKTLEDYLNDFAFNIDLSIEGKKNEEYSNLSLAFLNNAAYLSLNEESDNAVMRSKLTVESLNALISKIPDLTSALANGEADDEAAEGLFDFITSSELVTAIKDGRYDGILDVLKEIKNTNKTIELVLDLSSLGLGDNAEVDLVLNSELTDQTKVLSIDINNVFLGKVAINASLTTKNYSNARLSDVKTKADLGLYDDLDFVVGVFDQLTAILNTKQTGFAIEGAIAGSSNLQIEGNGQLDYGAKYGFGTMTLTSEKDSKVTSHKIDVDVNNNGKTNADKNVKFAYNNDLKGKFTIETITDIFDLVLELIEEKDGRFTKFIDPIKEMIIVGVVKEVVENEDYLALSKTTLLKEIKQYNNGNTLRLVINKAALELDSDITLDIDFKETDGKKNISSIKIVDLSIFNTSINLTVSLKDFSNEISSPVNVQDDFMDFSEIRVLLEFGINTTKLAYYNLAVSAKLSALSLNVEFGLKAHIKVDGKHTYVYGVIEEVPYVVLVSNDLGAKVSSEFVFEPIEDGSDDIGGYFHILRTEKHDSIFNKSTNQYYYKSTSKNFLDNILEYLICDILNIKSSIVTQINDAAGDTSGNSDPEYEHMFNDNGFQYTHTDEQDSWLIGLDLKALTGNNSLGDIDITLNGKKSSQDDRGYFSTAYVSMTLVKILKITANVELVSPDPSLTTWPTSCQNAYNTIVNIYNNMDVSNKNAFDSTYLNQPLKEYKVA